MHEFSVWMRTGSNHSDTANSFIRRVTVFLSVQARDDQQAYERMMSQQEREERIQRRMMLDMNRDPSPPRMPTYSNRSDILERGGVLAYKKNQ